MENLPKEDGEDPRNRSKKFSSYIKHKRSDNSRIGTLKVNSVMMTHSKAKAEALNQQFQSAFSIPTNEDNLSDGQNPKLEEMPRIVVSERGVNTQLRKLDPYKATGPDELSPRVLKELAHTICGPLTKLYQMSLDTATVPPD